MATKADEATKAKFDEQRLLRRCEACGQSSRWHIHEGRYALAGIDDQGRLTGNALPMYVATCVNCGFARLHHSDLLNAH